MKTLNLLGFDFGASSGRAMLGTLSGGKLEIREIHRFSNDPVTLCGRFVWDVPRMFYEMKQALLTASRDIPLCVTTNAHECYGHYWTENCCSWRMAYSW